MLTVLFPIQLQMQNSKN